MRIQIDTGSRLDQSGDTTFAFSNDTQRAVLLTQTTRDACLRQLKGRKLSRELRLFAACVYLLFKDHLTQLREVTIDNEYPGHVGNLKRYILNIITTQHGALTHYIADVAQFGHVMDNHACRNENVDEQHHSDYEDFMQSRTPRSPTGPGGLFLSYLQFDGSLSNISAYQAAQEVSRVTAQGGGNTKPALWMDEHYSTSNPVFLASAGDSLNRAVNAIADVLHSLYLASAAALPVAHPVINEVEANPQGSDASQEWVELYNPTDEGIDLSGWKLTATHGEPVAVTIAVCAGKDSTLIEAQGYCVILADSPWLDNAEEIVILNNGQNQEVDRTPALNDPYNDNLCRARFPNGTDTDSASDWKLQPCTQGSSNGG